MKLSEVTADVAAQLGQQAALGVKFEKHPEIPVVGPAHGGLWFKTPNAVAVFADLKRSTALNMQNPPESAPVAYSYFVRGMAAVFGRFSARYVDIQGDAVFGLFSGAEAALTATACAIAMRTVMKEDIVGRFRERRQSQLETGGRHRHRPGNAVCAAAWLERGRAQRSVVGQPGECGGQTQRGSQPEPGCHIR